LDERVRELRAEAEAKKLPEPEGMTVPVRLAELGRRGYMLKPCPTRPDETIALYRGEEYLDFGAPYSWGEERLTCAFLREARELDQV